MEQTSSLTRNLAEAQEAHARATVSPNATYRLYFEDTGLLIPETVAGIVCRFFSGFTSWFTHGAWLDVPEQSRIIEIVAPRADHAKVIQLAKTLRTALNQDSVLVSVTPTEMVLVSNEAF